MMDWVEKNPVGAALLGVCAALVLLGLGISWLWSDPGALDDDAAAPGGGMDLPAMADPHELGARGEYEIVVNRPVFNTTRRPIVPVEPEAVEVEEAPEEVVVTEPPKVRLTGVVITPTERVVTLTPEAGGEAIVIREGMPLDGEYVGWKVDAVSPRKVSLATEQGQKLDFELAVYDAVIARPPEPEPAVEATASADQAMPDDLADSGPATRSRADEIRERIRQRREQLRAEADEQAQDEEGAQEARASSYQSAIQQMIQRGRSQQNNEQDDSDDSGDNG